MFNQNEFVCACKQWVYLIKVINLAILPIGVEDTEVVFNLMLIQLLFKLLGLLPAVDFEAYFDFLVY